MSSAELNTIVREKVWTQLRKVAQPDSRFHHDYTSFIPDFESSFQASLMVRQLPEYQSADTIFVTPDNSTQHLRLAALEDGKKVLVTTYAIRRGFWLLDPVLIGKSQFKTASILDSMECVGKHLTLADVRKSLGTIRLMVTGAGAINYQGQRLGKGHGYFDLEWAMLYSIGVVTSNTQTIALVHSCQILEGDNTRVIEEPWDVGCDFVATDMGVLKLEQARKPTCGVLWDKLERGMLEEIEPLAELRMFLDSKDS